MANLRMLASVSQRRSKCTKIPRPSTVGGSSEPVGWLHQLLCPRMCLRCKRDSIKEAARKVGPCNRIADLDCAARFHRTHFTTLHYYPGTPSTTWWWYCWRFRTKIEILNLNSSPLPLEIGGGLADIKATARPISAPNSSSFKGYDQGEYRGEIAAVLYAVLSQIFIIFGGWFTRGSKIGTFNF